MELRQLEFMLALERYRTFSEAAQMLEVSQSTISAGINNLEEEIGALLVTNNKRKISFTEKGKIIVEKAKLIEKNIQAIHDISNDQELCGHIAIAGASHCYNMEIIDMILKIQKEYPKLVINLYDCNNETIIEEVSNGKYDFGLLQFSEIDDLYHIGNVKKNNLELFKTYRSKMCITAGGSSPFLHKNMTLKEVLSASTICMRYRVSEMFKEFFYNKGYNKEFIITHNIAIHQKIINEKRDYISIMPEHGIYTSNDYYNSDVSALDICDWQCDCIIGWVCRKDLFNKKKKFKELINDYWIVG